MDHLVNKELPHERPSFTRTRTESTNTGSTRGSRKLVTEPESRSDRLNQGTIWHDLRRTFATRLRAHGVHEYDIQDRLGHSKPGVTKVYARATQSVLEAAVEKQTQPIGQSGIWTGRIKEPRIFHASNV